MKRSILSGSLLGMVLLVAGCSDTTSPVQPSEPLYAKPTGEGGTSNPKTIWKLPFGTDTGLGLVGDGYYPDGTTLSNYEDGVCGVTSTIFLDGSNDGTMQTNNSRHKPRNCNPYALSIYPRKVTVVYPAAEARQPETMEAFLNARNIGTIPAGQRALRILSLNPTQTERCDAWRWSDETHNNVTHTGDKVWVERLADVDGKRRYHIYTQDRGPNPVAGANKATCTTTLQNHHLSVDFFIHEK